MNYDFENHHPRTVKFLIERAQSRIQTTQWVHTPTTNSLIRLAHDISILNDAVKFKDFPFKKYSFYQIKSYFIYWCIVQAKRNHKYLHYTIDRVERAPGESDHTSIALTLMIGDKTFKFHQILNHSALQWLLYDEIKYMEIVEFQRDSEPQAHDLALVTDLWDVVLYRLEYFDWFIYDHLSYLEWLDVIQARYPNTFEMEKLHPKFSNIINLGQKMVQVNKDREVLLSELRHKFHFYGEVCGYLGEYTLNPVKNNNTQ